MLWKFVTEWPTSLSQFQDNEELDLKDTEELVNDGQVLRIPASEVSHQGRYICVAENKAGRAEKAMVVSILRKLWTWFKSAEII